MKVWNNFLMVLTLGITITFGVLDKPIQMGIMVIFPLFFGVMSIIDKLKSFKISKEGVSAEIEKVNNEIISLKEALNLFSELSLTAFAYTGNWTDFSINDKEKILNDFIQKLKSKELVESEIDKLLEPWHKYILHDYCSKIINEVAILVRRSRGGAVMITDELDVYKSKSNNGQNQGIEYIKSYCSENNFKSEHLDNLISNYEYYEKNKKHKSKEEWLRLVNKH